LSLPSDFDLKERVRAAVDIVDVVAATTEVRPQGRHFVARCPWHDDRRPSMTVNQERQTWKCWPCDIGGDVFSFVMRRDGVDFPTAVRTLAELAGIPVEQYRGGKRTQPGAPDDRGTLLAAMQLVADAYYRELEQGTSDDARLARDYLAERGISDESRVRYRIGFAPDRWDFAVELLQQNGFSGEVAQAAGIASAKRSGSGHVDMFRGRLMFPIYDLQRRPIALGGRLIPAIAQRHGERAGGKYINGRETMLFRKSNQLYGLDLAREAIRRGGEALVMEGYTDVVLTRQAGIEPVVAVLGTALGEQHVKILKRLAQRVVLVLDGDEAGQNRADEVLELFVQADVDLRVLTLPEGQDPADFVAANGPETLERLVQQAPDALDHKLARLTDGVDLVQDTHAVTHAVDTMLKIVARAPDSLKTDQLLIRMAKRFDFKAERLERRLAVLRQEAKRHRNDRVSTRPTESRISSSAPGIRSSAAGPADPNQALAESAQVDFDGAQGYSRPPSSQDSAAAEALVARPSAPLRPLAGMERDLFEALIENPELAATAVEAIDPAWFETTTAKMLLSAYQDLDLAGHSLDIDSVLLLVENQQLKNQIVTLQERISNRANPLPQTVDERYAAIVRRYRELAFSIEQTKKIEQLASAVLPEDEEVAVLQALIEEERSKHGIRSNTSP
jgi:DNA primase